MVSKELLEEFSGPPTVDLLITGRCQMDCVCFRPAGDNALETISLDGWYEIVKSCNSVGTRHIVFSGGEPLLFRNLPSLLEFAKSLGLRTTLSTNALLFSKLHTYVMPYVDDVGIPLDSPTPEGNAVMRPPASLNQYQRAIEALQIIQKNYPLTDLTLRTVVSTANKNQVEQIPELLKRCDVNTKTLRWKLYQFSPAVPDALRERAEPLLLSTPEFLGICTLVRDKFRRFFGELSYFPVAVAEKNHFIVYPNGDAAILERLSQSQAEYSYLPHLQYTKLGNMVSGFDQTMANWRQRTLL